MAVRKKIDRKTGLPKIDKATGLEVWEAYWNARSNRFAHIRIQKVSDECATEEEAKKAEKQVIKAAIQAVALKEALGTCWKAIISAWEAECKRADGDFVNPVTGKKMTEQTVRDTVSTLKNWTKRWLDTPAGELNRSDGKAVIKAAEDAELSKSHLNRIKGCINTVFEYGVQERVILGAKESPVFGVPISIPDEDKLPEILTVEEVQKLLSLAKRHNHTWYPVWALALTTGMRSSELYALRKANVLMSEGLIRVCESWNWLTGEAKSTKSMYWRNAPIPPALMPLIESLMKTEGPYLLPRISEWEQGLQAMVLRGFCEQHGLPSVKFHTLRACFATHLLASGVEDAKVMRIGGWRDFKTFQIYVRLSGVREKGVSDKFAAVILPPTEESADRGIAERISAIYETTSAA